MQNKQDSYGVYEVDMETMEAFEISSVRARMEARREAQSEAWEAILRTAGGYIDFELDDLVALEDRAQAEFDRTTVARALVEARATEEARETEDDREERAAEYREDARKWSGGVEDLMWRHAGVGW